MSSGIVWSGLDWAVCQICFEYKDITELHEDETGQVWDICKDCQRREVLTSQTR